MFSLPELGQCSSFSEHRFCGVELFQSSVRSSQDKASKFPFNKSQKNFNDVTMTQRINIAIDGLTATGKTSIRQEVAEKLGYKFIDSELFYRYFAKIFYWYGKEDLIDGIKIIKQEIDDPKEFLKKLNSLYDLSNDDFFKYGKQASEIVKYEELR